MADAMSIKFDTGGIDAALDRLTASSAELARPAAQAGAQVLYDEVLIRVPVGLKGHWFHGKSFAKTGQKYYFDAGSLKAAIYQAYSKDRSSDVKATYHVSWNATKAPYGHMVESGTSRAPAHAFLRPAYDGSVDAALAKAKSVYQEGMQKVLA